MEKHLLSRRRFLGLALTGSAAVALGARLAPGGGIQASDETPTSPYALIIDTTKCTGCGACIEACRLRNHLPEGQSYIHGLLKGDEHVRWYLMVQCQHCANPPCATVCPTHATYVRQDGVVLINEKLCVGCRYCIVACPYQARIFGRTDDPNSAVSQLIASGRAQPFHPEFGTHPAVLSYIIEG